MEGFMEVELMVTKRDDDNRRPTTDRQGEYRAICLWKMEWQSFAKIFQNKTFKDGDVSSRSLDHDCTYWRGEEKGKYKTVTTHDKYQ